MDKRTVGGFVGGWVALATCLWACGGGGDASQSPDPSGEQERLLCESCKPLPGGDTGDFPSSTGADVNCDVDRKGAEWISMEEARSRGFDPDPQLEAATISFMAPVRWYDTALPDTQLHVEVRPKDEGILLRWGGIASCPTDEFVEPWVTVTIESEDGLVFGTFDSPLASSGEGYIVEPRFGGGGTMLNLRGDASTLGGSLEFEHTPEGATLEVFLHLLYDRPQVAPRAELSLVLTAEDEDGDWYGEGHSARPSDGCLFRTVPQGVFDTLDDKPLAIGPPSCHDFPDSHVSDQRCCYLQDYFEGSDELQALAERCVEGDQDACDELPLDGWE